MLCYNLYYGYHIKKNLPFDFVTFLVTDMQKYYSYHSFCHSNENYLNHIFAQIFNIFVPDFFCESLNSMPKYILSSF